jgi:hypothetical protein
MLSILPILYMYVNMYAVYLRITSQSTSRLRRRPATATTKTDVRHGMVVVAKAILNVVTGLVIAVYLILSIMSVGSAINGVMSTWGELLWIHIILTVSCAFSYFLNRPQAYSVIRFYNRKWSIVPLIFVVVIILAASLPYLTERMMFLQWEFSYRGSTMKLADLLTLPAQILSPALILRLMWVCPRCKHRLPMLSSGSSAEFGFNIKVCPSCNEILNNA